MPLASVPETGVFLRALHLTFELEPAGLVGLVLREVRHDRDRTVDNPGPNPRRGGHEYVDFASIRASESQASYCDVRPASRSLVP